MKVQRNQASVIKEMMYPAQKKADKGSHKKNLNSIKSKEEENRIKREEKENYIPPEPYKMKEFKNVQSKLYTKTQEWIMNEKELTKEKNPQMKPKPQSQMIKKKPFKSDLNQYNTNPKGNSQEPESMFENYYKSKKLREKSQSPPKKMAQYNNAQDAYPDENIYGNHQPQVQGHGQGNEHDAYEEDNEKMNDNYKELLKEYEEIKNAQLKGPTPRINEGGEILPKIAKNYVKENKQVIADNKIVSKVKPQVEEKTPIHRDYGKTPDYLKKMKEEAEIRKEVIKQMKEEAKYPKGTRLLSEEERLATLNGLIESKKEIETLLEKLPITLRTKASQSKKDELEKKLDEIESAISTFSRKQVFIKVDS